MKLKTSIFLSLCPALSILLNCNRDIPVNIGSEFIQEFEYAESSLLFDVVLPDSIQTSILWEENMQLTILSKLDSTTVFLGDTILFGVDPFFLLEKQRIQMFLDIAEELNDFSSIDSLNYLLTDSSSYFYLPSNYNGLIDYRSFPNETIQKSDTIAIITTAPPDSLYYLVPRFEQINSSFEIAGGIVSNASISIFDITPKVDKVSLPEIWEVKPNCIYEDNLNSFLLTTAGDTISVLIIGTTDSTRVLFSTICLDSIPLTVW